MMKKSFVVDNDSGYVYDGVGMMIMTKMLSKVVNTKYNKDLDFKNLLG